MAAAECDVCDGLGDYHVIDRHGSVRYLIRCPECCGSGQVEPEQPACNPPDWPPPSTAARIKSMDELRSHIALNKAPYHD